MSFCAQYGSRFSFYGNIQFGRFALPIKSYGAWPEEKPAQKGMLVGDWQDPAPLPIAEKIVDHIGIIKRLKEQLEQEQDLTLRNNLRGRLRKERDAKEKAFRLKAMIDEEESLFMLLH